MRGKRTNGGRAKPQGAKPNPLDALLRGLSDDPAASVASRNWARRLLESEQVVTTTLPEKETSAAGRS
jgi:hypothetical protein